MEEEVSKFQELGEFFAHRLKKPVNHPEYWLYVFIVIIGFGAIGVWSSWSAELKNCSFSHVNVIHNISSFSLAIIATGSIELMFIKNERIKISMLFISFAFIGLCTISFFSCNSIASKSAYWLSIPTAIISLLIWWIANAENANLTKSFFMQQSDKSKEFSENLDDYEEQ